jgi:hypothetical protein
MALARKKKPLTILALLISAVAASAASLTPALASGAQARPAAANAKGAYLWSDNDPDYNFSTAAPQSSVAKVVNTATGTYEVEFAHLGGIAHTAVVQTTSYETSDDCSPSGWAATGTRLNVIVQCWNVTTGTLEDVEFDVLVTSPVSPPSGTFDYAFVNRSASSGQLSRLQYNSAHKKNWSTHLGTGKYQVLLGGPKTTGTTGVVKISAYGSEPGDCEVNGWKGSAKGELVNVDCYGLGHTLENREFIVTYTTASSLLGLKGQVVANAFANGKAQIYQPADQYDSVKGARVTVVRYGLGFYEVVPIGSGGNFLKWGGNVEISAVGNKGAHCFSYGWNPDTNPSLEVICVNKNGDGVDSPFTIEWVVP